MSQYLLSTYAVEGAVPGAPRTPEDMQGFMERVMTLEAEMDADGAFVYGGALHGPEAATVVRPRGGDGVLTTDGPFVESKEQIGGFYIIEADDLDAALAWARKVADATDHSIEVRPFRATAASRPRRMAYDEALAERIRSVLADRQDVTEQKMFGGIAFMIGGRMAVGVVHDDPMVRVGPDAHDDAVAHPHVRPMDITGPPMRGFVYVAPAGVVGYPELQRWVEAGASFAASQPPRKHR